MINQDKFINEYCNQLLKLEDLGKRHGLSRCGAYRLVKKLKLVRNGNIRSDIRKPSKEQLIADYTGGLSIQALKNKYHTRDVTILRWLNEYDIERLKFYERRKYPEISNIQREFILGGLLGDASIVKHGAQYRLSITHNESQREYIEHKKKILDEFGLNVQPTISKVHNSRIFIRGKWVDRTIAESHGCILHSKVHPYFTELREKLYPDNKKTVTDWWLDQLTPSSLAYWFMDDGTACYTDNSYRIGISTYSFTHDEHLLLCEFLESKFGIEMRIQPTPNRGFGFTTRFRTEDSKKLRDLVGPHVVKCMKYKINREVWETRNV